MKEDEDRLGIRTGIGLKKAAAIKRAAERFMAVEQDLYAKARAKYEANKAAGTDTAGAAQAAIAEAAEAATTDKEGPSASA